MAATVTPRNGEITYLVLADRAVPYLLARVRWPDVAQAISAGCPDWLDDIGLFDLPHDPNAVPVSFTQAASVAAGWGRKLGTEPAANVPSFIRRMPANWSDMTPGERRAFGLERAGRRRLPVRRLRRIRASQATISAPAPEGDVAERRHQVRVRVDGRGHIRSGQSTVSAALVDLSEGGMRCVLPDASLVLTPGQELGGPFLLEGEAAGSRICIAVPGRISWILDSSSGTHFGLAFGDLNGGEIEGVHRFQVTASSRRG
jgi:PilZ domain